MLREYQKEIELLRKQLDDDAGQYAPWYRYVPTFPE